MQILQQWERWEVLGAVMYQMGKLLHQIVDCMVLWTSHQGYHHLLAPPECHRLLKMEMKLWKLKAETWGMTVATLSVTCLVSPLTSGMVLQSVPPEQLLTTVKYHFPLQMQWIFRYWMNETLCDDSCSQTQLANVVDKWKLMFPECRFWISETWSDPSFESS